MVDFDKSGTSTMSLNIFPYFLVIYFLTVVPLAQLVFPLELSDDTLKTIKHDKFYPSGCANSKEILDPSNYANFSLARPTGAIALAKLEYEMYSVILKKIIDPGSSSDEKGFVQALEEYTEDYNTTASSLMQSGMGMESCVKSVAGNIIAVYRMVRRFRSYIQPWILERKKRKALPFQSEVLDAINPSGESLDVFTNDFHLAIIPIIMTQFVMDWKANDICKGTIKGLELGSTLKAVHCQEIGVHAIASGMYPIGIEWIELALSKAVHENDTTLDVHFVMDILDKAYAKHDERWLPTNRGYLEETFYKRRLNTSVKGTKEQVGRQWQKGIENIGIKLEAQEIEPMERFCEACQGKIKQPEHIKWKLFCWLETSVHPTWKIGPLKAELISGFPDDMVLFHDVIGKSLSEDIIRVSQPLLRPGTLYSSSLNPKIRLSSSCYIIQYPTLESRLDGLTETITGLGTKQTTLNHVTSSPAGGHMNLHLDLINQEGEDDYIASVIYYFKAANIGGGTGFTGAQVLLEAPSGSAVFWYHMFKSGVIRKGGAHGSCPVIQGQKWVGVKWLQYTKQTQLVCGTDEHSRMEYMVNGKSKYE